MFKKPPKGGFFFSMSIIIYQEHCEFLEKQNKELKNEVLFLKQMLEYKTLGLPLTEPPVSGTIDM